MASGPVHRRRWGVPALLLLLLLAALPWTLRTVRAAGRPPNVILITLDTLRADRLGSYGCPRPTTPNLDRFAERATRFTHAYTPQGFTLTAHLSLSTSLYPSVHQVDEKHALPRKVKLLSERLHAAGYRTLGVVDDVPWMAPQYGFARGFDAYEQVHGDAAAKTRLVEELLREPTDAPVYLKLHFFDVHSDAGDTPYEARRDDAELFTSWYQGPYRGCSETGKCGTQHLIEIQTTGRLPDADVRRLITDEYDAGVRTLDRQLGDLLGFLERTGRFDDSIIVITADHGELLFEHDTVLHGHLWDESLHIPLLVHLPGQAHGAVRDDLVSLVDVAPTLLDLLALAPMELSQGTSFAGALRGEAPAERPVVELSANTLVFGVRDTRWKLFGQNEYHLYDLAADPREATNLWRQDRIEGPARVLREALRTQRLAAADLRRVVGAPLPLGTLDDDQRARLDGLGYTSGEDAPEPDDDGLER